jgi:hypothetical protein
LLRFTRLAVQTDKEQTSMAEDSFEKARKEFFVSLKEPPKPSASPAELKKSVPVKTLSDQL